MRDQITSRFDDISIVISGEAGQGVDTVAHVLTGLFKLSKYNLFSTKEYMSRIRGGCNSTLIRVSSNPVSAYNDKIDILFAFSPKSLDHLKSRITNQTIVIGESDFLNESFKSHCCLVEVPITNIAKEIGNRLFANTVVAGLVAGLFNIPFNVLSTYLKNTFDKKGAEVVEKNLIAAQKGYDIGKNITTEYKVEFSVTPHETVTDQMLMAGVDAVAIGALTGGCNFISSYPMSPATGVFTYLSQKAKTMNLIAEQVEDEIAAINMALGASYAGSRAMVSTSGGGFALMTEGVSLAGIIETPVVIHIAQRPGPATGLPTRTEQGDLNLALYAGHGEFPRVILAPGTLEEAFYLTAQAFNIADKFQIPVFVLTDQYFVDSSYNTDVFDLSNIQNENFIIKTDKDYKRYALTENGISPRGIPGYGDGFVLVDSDEHDEDGRITESMEVRVQMMDKRLYKKQEEIKSEIIPPEFYGSDDYSVLIVGWGSTHNNILEAIKKSGRDDVAYIHFKQVYPLYPQIDEYLDKAKTSVIIEMNATSQFGSLIKQTTGKDFDIKILKFNGISFSVEELTKAIQEI